MTLFDRLVKAGVVDEEFTNIHSRLVANLIKNGNQSLLNEIYVTTSFLSDNVSMSERIYCIFNNILEPVCCKNSNCPNKVNYTNRKCYSTFCSTKCSSSNVEVKQKTTDTNLKRYGTTHPGKLQVVKDKTKQTNLSKYGVDYPNKLQSIRDKTAKTNTERYGTINPLTNMDLKSIMLDKYGVDNPMRCDTIHQRQRETMLDRYGVEFPQQNDDIKLKTKQTNLDRYGTVCSISSKQQELNEQRKLTNNERYQVNYPQQSDIKDSLIYLNNSEWLKEHHHNLKKPLTEIANELHVDPETVRNYCIIHKIKVNRYSVSTGHNQIVHFLQSIGVEVVLINNRTLIAPFEVDIYLPKYKLAIEYCGLYWHSDIHKRIGKQYHLNKTNLCIQQQVQLLTIFEDEWHYNKFQIQQKLISLCNKRQSVVYARKTKIITINAIEKRKFLDKHHIQGTGPGKLTYALTFEDQIVAVMTFINNNGKYTLNRYATSLPVIGGFSKLLTHFKRNNTWAEIISFADRRWSIGGLYESTGFELDSIVPPTYYYIEGKRRSHRGRYQHKYLSQRLADYDPTLTEFQNCNNNGVLRIWDCGLLRYKMLNQ